MRPKFAGKPLVGTKGTRIPDSDAGRLDGDRRFDRPVGPMQLAPSTWAVVGVDGDGDGRRNPDDIDDASLAVSVLLCQGDDDLRKRPGRISAVKRINDDRTFIETVLAVARAYRTQVTEAADDDPILVAKVPYTDLPTDLPTDDGFTRRPDRRPDRRADRPGHLASAGPPHRRADRPDGPDRPDGHRPTPPTRRIRPTRGPPRRCAHRPTRPPSLDRPARQTRRSRPPRTRKRPTDPDSSYDGSLTSPSSG